MGLSFAHENPFLYHLGHGWPSCWRWRRGHAFRPFIHADGNRATDSRRALFLARWLGYRDAIRLEVVGSGGLSAGRSVIAPNSRCSKRRKSAVAELNVRGTFMDSPLALIDELRVLELLAKHRADWLVILIELSDVR